MHRLPRRLPGSLLSLVLVVPGLVLLPALHERASAAPHPVTPSIEQRAALLPALAPQAVGGIPGVTTGPAQSTRRFSLIGASWPADAVPAPALVQVRTLGVGGRWSPWSTLDRQDAAPDPGSTDARSQAARTGALVHAEPVWTGPATAVQARVSGAAHPTGLTLDLIDPGTSAADAPSGPGAAAADAAPAQPVIYSRAAWGADESLRTRNPGCGTPTYAATVKVAFVHHTDGTNAYTAADVPSIIRGIYAYHVEGEGWCDIGYNFLADQFGRIWEGRYGGVTRPVVGAHSGGFNTYSTGVAMIGEYTSVTPSAALQSALARLLAWKLSLTYANPAGTTSLVSAGGPDTAHPAGQVVPLAVISGHRDADQTSCPGNAGYATLPALRRAVSAATGPALVGPFIAYSQPLLGGPAVARFGAGVTSPAPWSFTVRDAAGAVVRAYAGYGTVVGGTWDGRRSGGVPAPAGLYSLTIAAGAARTYAVGVRVTGSLADLGIVGQQSAGGPVEVHVLRASTGYQTYVGHWVTALTVGDPQNWRYLLAPFSAPGAEDLVAVHLTGGASGRVEVHVLSAVSGYRTYVAHLATAQLVVDPADFQVDVGSYLGDRRPDLSLVETQGGASGRVEVHVLAAATSYATFLTHRATALPAVAAGAWTFLTGGPGGDGDLVGVLRAGASGDVEVHVLTAASGYGVFSLHRATPLPATTPASDELSLADRNGDGIPDLGVVLLDGASGHVELHVLDGASGFGTWQLHVATPQAPLDPAAWTVALAG